MHLRIITIDLYFFIENWSRLDIPDIIINLLHWAIESAVFTINEHGFEEAKMDLYYFNGIIARALAILSNLSIEDISTFGKYIINENIIEDIAKFVGFINWSCKGLEDLSIEFVLWEISLFLNWLGQSSEKLTTSDSEIVFNIYALIFSAIFFPNDKNTIVKTDESDFQKIIRNWLAGIFEFTNGQEEAMIQYVNWEYQLEYLVGLTTHCLITDSNIVVIFLLSFLNTKILLFINPKN